MKPTEEDIDKVAYAIWRRSKLISQAPLMNAREYWDCYPNNKLIFMDQAYAAIETWERIKKERNS